MYFWPSIEVSNLGSKTVIQPVQRDGSFLGGCIADINDTAIPTGDRGPDSRTPAVVIAPRPAVSPLPDIPAVPVSPVRVVEKLEEPKIPPLPRVRVRATSNYADVKVFYEQANRFLDEIK